MFLTETWLDPDNRSVVLIESTPPPNYTFMSEARVHMKGGGVGPARNSDTSLFRRLNGPKYFPLDRHATMPTVQCSENGTHCSEGPFVRLFKKEAH